MLANLHTIHEIIQVCFAGFLPVASNFSTAILYLIEPVQLRTGDWILLESVLQERHSHNLWRTQRDSLEPLSAHSETSLVVFSRLPSAPRL